MSQCSQFLVAENASCKFSKNASKKGKIADISASRIKLTTLALNGLAEFDCASFATKIGEIGPAVQEF